MESDRVLNLLGKPSSDPSVVELLKVFGARKYRPALDEDKPELMTDWFPVEEAGIEFGFEDEAYLKALDPSLRRKGRLIFHEVIFYGEHQRMDPFRGDLPLQLSFQDSRPAVQSKMERWKAPRRSHVRDVWELPDFRIIVSYSKDGTRIVDMIACLREEPWPPPDELLPPFPTIQAIVGLLGKPADKPFANLFRRFGVVYYLDQMTTGGVIDLRQEYGFELHVGSATSVEPGIVRAPLIFNQITVYRDRDLDARGWGGELPFNIDMNDSPPVVLAKVGRPPAQQNDDHLMGSVLWHFPSCSLHIIYSTLDNLVYRVTLARPGLFHN